MVDGIATTVDEDVDAGVVGGVDTAVVKGVADADVVAEPPAVLWELVQPATTSKTTAHRFDHLRRVIASSGR